MNLVKTWVKRILAGTHTYAEVPAPRKVAVKEMLHDLVNEAYMGDGELFTPEKYEEVVGEPYEV